MKCVLCNIELVADKRLVGRLIFGGQGMHEINDGLHCPKCGIKYVDIETWKKERGER